LKYNCKGGKNIHELACWHPISPLLQQIESKSSRVAIAHANAYRLPTSSSDPPPECKSKCKSFLTMPQSRKVPHHATYLPCFLHIYIYIYIYIEREREREREKRDLHSILLRKKKDIQKGTLYLMASSFDSDLPRQLLEHIP
jgi:hypothetical protein